MSPKITRLGYCPDCGRDMEADFCHNCGKEFPDAVRIGRRSIFVRGGSFSDFGELKSWLDAGGWVYWTSDRKPKHPSVILSMTISTVAKGIGSGRLCRAVRRDDLPEARKDEPVYYAVIDREGKPVTVCGGRLAVYPFVTEAREIVDHEAKMAGPGARVAVVVVIPRATKRRPR